MIITWRGWGILVPVLPIAWAYVIRWVERHFASTQNVSVISNVLSFIAMLSIAFAIWRLGRYLNNRDTPGAKSNFHVAHSFLILRMEYWGVVIAVLTVVFFVAHILI